MASAGPRSGTVKLAVVGDETLLGRELREVLGDRGSAAVITAYAATGEGNFGEDEGEAVYREPLEAESLRNAHAVIVAGSPEGALKAYGLAKAAGGNTKLVDCTGHLDDKPEARIVAPLLEPREPEASWLLVMAHPAASALALVLSRLAKHKPIRRAIAHVFEPASERGKRGLSELHEQTSGLLAFKPLKKDVFDAQLSFNMLSQYGEEAPQKLAAVERRIETHLATLLSRQNQPSLPMPSLRLIQAPVFHGYSISLWAEFESDIRATELGETLGSAQIEIRGENEEAPTNVGAASQSGLAVGDIRVDHNNPRAAWFWIVGDNLRLMADATADLIASIGAEQR